MKFIENLRRILNPSQISNWALGAILLITLSIEAGFIYVLTENPELFGKHPGTRNNMMIEYSPSLSSQVVIEMIIIFSVISLGVLGFYLIQMATRYSVDDPNRGLLILAIGIFLFVGNVIFLFLLFNYKLTTKFPDFTM
jgi:hypothetical protein